MNDQAWMDSHYPRCVRCGLRTYVSNLTGARCAEVTGTAQCPAYNLPESDRPAYPYVDSLHAVEIDKSAGQKARETPPEGSDPSLPPIKGRSAKDYTVLPEGFTFERPAVLDADPDMDFTVAVVRGIGVEYRHVACGYGDVEVVEVVPDMGTPTYRVFGSWVEAHDYVCDTARREVLDEMGHDCSIGWTYGVGPCEGCAAVWCDYCETGDHATTDCPHPDHEAYDAAQGAVMETDGIGVERCCADYSYVPSGRTMVETHTFDCETAQSQSKVWWDAR